jgi:hypothetical protein
MPLLEYDPMSGVGMRQGYDPVSDSFFVQSVQNVDAIVESNKREYNTATGKWEEWKKVASIPMTLYMKLQQIGIARDEDAFTNWLDDSANRFFRTRPGRLSRRNR